MNASSNDTESVWLGRFAKVVVVLTFWLIFIGGHTTTSGAGMAFPDWPLSHGSLNPPGWWENQMQRLEHGHRYTAEALGLFIGILCAWVWRSKSSAPIAIAGAVVLAAGALAIGLKGPAIAHVGIWSSAIIFSVLLFRSARQDTEPRPGKVRFLAYAAFLGVCIQALLGGLRVIKDPAGSLGGDALTATILRVAHGCFAQLELCLLVCIAAMLSPVWMRITPQPSVRGVHRLAWITVTCVFLQLVAGATMRHLGAGLAIPSFPHANPDGGWLPAMSNIFVNLNFGHTRIGAVVVTLMIVTLAGAVLRGGGGVHLARPAVLLLVLVGVQFTMGVFVIWKLRPPILTTLHVVNGAAVLATTLLLAVRAGRAKGLESKTTETLPSPNLTELHA